MFKDLRQDCEQMPERGLQKYKELNKIRKMIQDRKMECNKKMDSLKKSQNEIKFKTKAQQVKQKAQSKVKSILQDQVEE